MVRMQADVMVYILLKRGQTSNYCTPQSEVIYSGTFNVQAPDESTWLTFYKSLIGFSSGRWLLTRLADCQELSFSPKKAPHSQKRGDHQFPLTFHTSCIVWHHHIHQFNADTPWTDQESVQMFVWFFTYLTLSYKTIGGCNHSGRHFLNIVLNGDLQMRSLHTPVRTQCQSSVSLRNCEQAIKVPETQRRVV